MKDRIKHYIEHKEISAGELSVLLDVQRSNISHILNGRNKPGAVFIEKFLKAFPNLNARWLLTGEGVMSEDSAVEVKLTDNTLPFATTPKIDVEPKPEATKDESISNPIKEHILPLASSDNVEKMILLFKDGTFVTYSNRDLR